MLLLLSQLLPAQQVLQGIVTDAEKNLPVQSASVFLSNTSFGTTTNDAGRFVLQVPPGRYDLVVSSIGYQTFSRAILSQEQKEELTIRLLPRAPELETVYIEPAEKNGWEKWGRFFADHFIGTSAAAKRCIIVNSGALRFRHSKKRNELSVTADEPVLIENTAMGYRLRYQLESFVYDFRSRQLVYAGFPLFEAMEGTNRQRRKWNENRREAYLGSMMHFMRSLYRNRLNDDGFEVRRLKKILNEKKVAAKRYYARRFGMSKDGTQPPLQDSDAHYREFIQQDDYTDVIARGLLSGDSIAYALDSTTVGLQFDDYLLVNYRPGTTPAEYRQLYPKHGTNQISQITLMDGREVEIQANGYYYDPTQVFVLGFWAWSEKISNLLPLNYKPE